MNNRNFSYTRLVLILSLLGIMLVAEFPQHAFADARDVTRVSVTNEGAQSNGFSDWGTLSADGRFIAFNSEASNLVPGDTNGVSDSFVRDTVAGTTTRVSVDSNGIGGNDHSYDSVISADGRYVTFISLASNLVVGDDDGTYDVFVHDMQTGVTEGVSIDLNGNPGGRHSYHQSISADGRYIAFNSSSNDLVPGDTNSSSDVFVRDMQTGTTTRISVDANGVQGDKSSFYTNMSADGRYVTFHSSATNLVMDDTNGRTDIFVYDTHTNAIMRASVDSNSAQSLNGDSWYPSISGDGRYVAFRSSAANLVLGDTNGKWDIFVHDRHTGVITRASVDSNGVEADDDSLKSSISADGRYVVFDSYATTLVPGDTNVQGDIFQHDMLTGTTIRISVDSNGAQALNGESLFPSISSNGQYVAFTSHATNLVEGDTNSNADIFVYEQDLSPISTPTATFTATNTSTLTPTPTFTATNTPTSTATATLTATNTSTLTPTPTFTATDIYPTDYPGTDPSFLFVKWNASGANDGSSWTDAYTDLQSALSAASNGDEIWVAAGTYKPTSGTDRAISFELKDGVAIYGGFAGTETVRTERDFQTNITILSGDIGIIDDNADNSYHVVTESNTSNSTILDGFTITSGNAFDASPASNPYGGGLYSSSGNSLLSNLIFEDNYAYLGGGMYSEGFASWNSAQPTLTNVTFINNSAQEGGGMESRYYSSPVLTNVAFIGNTSGRSGGGLITLYPGNPILTNVSFSNNTAALAGGGFSSLGTDSVLTNVTFSGNSSGQWGGGMDNAESTSTLTNVTFYGNSASTFGGAISNHVESDLTLTNVTMVDNSAVTYGDGVYKDSDSILSIRNSILYNNGEEIYGTADVTYSIVEGGYTGVGNLNANPLLGELADNGGFTQTMALLPGSPAIDTGNDDVCPDTDQRGVARPVGSHCDIGAYESAIVEPSFTDVPVDHSYFEYIEILYANGLTNGCSTVPLKYCPSSIMNRAQVAKFFMMVEYGGSYLPPADTKLVFKDSWKINPWAKLWANDMYAKKLTNGCKPSPLLYCPDRDVIREQVAKFGLAIKYGNDYEPPDASGTVFADLTDVNYWATAWAEQAYADGLVPACGMAGGKPKFCPYDEVNRGFAAFVIVTATGLLGP